MDDPNFDSDTWINSQVPFIGSDDTKQYETQYNQLLIRLQLTSREISQSADHALRSLSQSLPSSMARLKRISDGVSGLSESLRGLTNSGYKFKSGSPTDELSGLSALNARRDRLKEAAERLQRGVDIEKDMQQLFHDASIGELSTVCEKYKAVFDAAESLSSIERFAEIRKRMGEVQTVIERRIQPELSSACAVMNNEAFIKCRGNAEMVGLPQLPYDAIIRRCRQLIEKEKMTYDSEPPIPICDWLLTCLNKCEGHVMSFSKWSQSLGYSFQDQLIKTFEDVMSPVIESHLKILLSSFKFDELVMVVEIIREFQNASKNKYDEVFKNCISNIKAQFYDSLQQFFYTSINIPKQIPKSSTSGSLAKNSLPSPSKSNDSLHQQANTQLSKDYDPKLLENCILLSLKSIQWIKILANEPIRCVRFINSFILQTMQYFSNKLKNNLLSEYIACQNDDQQRSLYIGKLLQLYTSQDSLEKKLRILESDARSILETFETPSMKFVKDVIEEQILTTMSDKSLKLLKNLHNSAEWSFNPQNQSNNDNSYEPDELEILDQSQYIKTICLNIMAILHQLTQGKNLSNDMISKWTTKTAEAVIKAYTMEIASIPLLSEHGQEQLKTDIEYLLNLLSDSMGLECGKDLPAILNILSAKPEDRKKALTESEISPHLARGLSVSLSIK